jgi:hypothetical protein
VVVELGAATDGGLGVGSVAFFGAAIVVVLATRRRSELPMATLSE